MFYQLILYDFGNFECIAINPSLSIKELAMAALDTDESGWSEDDGPKEELAERVSEILVEKSKMLQEYFAIGFDENGNIQSLPALLSKINFYIKWKIYFSMMNVFLFVQR